MSKVPPPARWRTPEELLTVGLGRSRVILVNEAHSGLMRSIRTRRIGRRLIHHAHDAGVRHLAMEALNVRFADEANRTREVPGGFGYLAQTEMRELIADALDLGWELLPYEADIARKPAEFANRSIEETNWREEQQARNLFAALIQIPADSQLLVWCGNHHLAKEATGDWLPMGLRLAEISGLDPFAIDQTIGVRFNPNQKMTEVAWITQSAAVLDSFGGTAGFLAEDEPADWPYTGIADAYLLSSENDLE